jgi:hypothetical protein
MMVPPIRPPEQGSSSLVFSAGRLENVEWLHAMARGCT